MDGALTHSRTAWTAPWLVAMDPQQQRRLCALRRQLAPSPRPSSGSSFTIGAKTVVITGANRGLGLEFVRQYASASEDVRLYACCRKPSAATELVALASSSGGLITVHELDVTDAGSVHRLAAALDGVAVDVLINNSAMNPDPSTQNFSGDIDYSLWAEAMDTNVYGVVRVTKALLPSLLLSQQKKLIHIGSRAGSVSSQLVETGRKGQLIYRSSKAALNMTAKLLDVELAELGVLSLVIHPGHVQTDMGGDQAPLTPQQSVSGMVRCIEFLQPALDGDANMRFVWYDGRSIGW